MIRRNVNSEKINKKARIKKNLVFFLSCESIKVCPIKVCPPLKSFFPLVCRLYLRMNTWAENISSNNFY